MITLDDCIGLSPVDADELYAIAEHERLPVICALEKATTMLEKPWGDASIRQMLWDTICHARENGDELKANRLMVVYRQTCMSHSGTEDRRRGSGRPTHPFNGAAH